MNKVMFDTVMTFVKHQEYDDVHNYPHIIRVLSNAMYIAEDYSIDYGVLIAACLLHDIGRSKKHFVKDTPHATVGARVAFAYLRELGWDTNLASAVSDCISSHSFRDNCEPKSIEAKILFDADKIDLTGHVGIARALAFGNAIREPLYSLNERGGLSQIDDEKPSFILTYNNILQRVDERTYTKRGYDMILKRKSSADRFFAGLISEINDVEQNYKLVSKVLER